MTDPIREAFEKHHKNKLCFEGHEVIGCFMYRSGRTLQLWKEWYDAWKQSRREAFMEAAMLCEYSKDYAKLIRAAAEEEGK